MDAKNRFHTPVTYWLHRLDYLALLVLLVALAAAHAREIHWGWFLLAFWWIDVIGYAPGAVWYRWVADGGRKSLPAVFPIAYNVCHSVALNAVIVAAWYVAQGGWSWTMLAQPIHLCIDRGLFGNLYKPLGLSFEPVVHPLFEKFDTEFRGAGTW